MSVGDGGVKDVLAECKTAGERRDIRRSQYVLEARFGKHQEMVKTSSCITRDSNLLNQHIN